MFLVGGLYLPDGEVHFAQFGDDLPQRQQADRENAYRYVTNWDLAVDVGAHVGIFTCAFAKRFERVLAFEPIPETRECLAANVPENVTIMPYAVGDHAEQVKMVRAKKASGGSFVYNEATAAVVNGQVPAHRFRDVEMRPLDSFDIEGVGLIKLDVQGLELQALMGARETLLRCRPVVLVEEKPLGGKGGDESHILKLAEFLIGLGMAPREKPQADRTYVFPRD